VVRFRNCDPNKKDGNTAFIRHKGQLYRFQPRLKLLDNSLEDPAGATGTDMCPAVPKTFVNAPTCVRRASCGAPAASSTEITLNQGSLRRWFTGSNRFVYYVTGLRLESPYDVSPCAGISRWVRSNGACAPESPVSAATKTTILTAIARMARGNNLVRNIELNGQNCQADPGIQVTETSGQNQYCWKHSHPNEYDVRDFTAWGTGNTHPGNAASTPNPIYKWARQGGVELKYPASHPMSRWGEDNLKHIPLVGIYGNKVDFQALSTELQTADMAQFAGAAVQNGAAAATGFESCGSPEESANNGTLGHRYIMRHNRLDTNAQESQLDWVYDLRHGKSMAWLNNVLSAPDQLRQRVAWALAQIFTLADGNLDFHRDEVEIWGAWYDIFIRHAFGNYRDMLREVSFSPIMGEYLTFLGSRSFEETKTFPDENYAREIMQLFSIGLFELNEDGTRVVRDGDFVDAYTDTEIVDFARVWTGFDRQQPRSNMESPEERLRNTIDPMQIKPAWRDHLPKAKLDAGFLGDQYPLCGDVDRPWMRPGAKFVFTGQSSAEGPELDGQDQGTFKNRGRFEPVANGPFFNALCGPRAADGSCTFPSEVVLGDVLPCSAHECQVESIVTVTIRHQGVTGYYTYVRKPCVDLTFFQSGHLLQYGNTYQCGDPKMAIGNPTCCQKNRPNRQGSNADTAGMCLFGNERVTWATQAARCEAADLVMCREKSWRSSSWSNSCAQDNYQWINQTCTVKVQVLPTGMVMLVDPETSIDLLEESNGNLFRVKWNTKNAYPKATDAGGCGANCVKVDTVSDATCVCEVSVINQAVFAPTAANPNVPSAAVVLNRLQVGAYPPASHDAGTYSQCTAPECVADPQLKVWVRAGAANWGADTTIFEVAPIHAGGSPIYLRNLESTVAVAGRDTMSFRNPPHFMPLFGEAPARSRPWRSADLLLPQAEQEVDALIDHLFYHKNTPPFVAYRLIQRMVTSNPSPRYVKSVARAFKTGTYAGQMFSGRYGCMQAAVHAVLRDQEARSLTVEADPMYGQLREPLLKVIQLLRTLDFKTKDGKEVQMPELMNRIGQDAFRQPSVFGFFLPEFRPAGPVEDSGLVAPEAQLSTTPQIVNYLNGLTSLIDFGLTHCNGGFGYRRVNSGNRRCGNTERNREDSDGSFNYKPTVGTGPEVIGELNTLLTADRLAPATAEYMVNEYQRVMTASGPEDALRHALKMFITSSEFQMNNANILTPVQRVFSSAAAVGAGRSYKAIVVIFEGGGADSFNLVVPHSNCRVGNYYNEYREVRTGAAIDQNQLLTINVPGAEQPCRTFGVHPEMPALHQLYNERDAAFFANIGGLVEPLTKDDYRRRSGVIKQRPPSPSAHNIAQRSLQNVHAQNSNAKGVLGRTVDALKQARVPYAAEMYSIAGNQKMVEGVLGNANIIDQNNGVIGLRDGGTLRPVIDAFTQNKSTSAFAETYADIVSTSLRRTEAIANLLRNTDVPDFGRQSLERQMRQVAKLIKMRTELKTERAVFFTSQGGWDTHRSFNPPWGRVDSPLGKFQTEMKAQGIWDDVVVVSVSDFGRTLTSNGQGTDHAWGGNHFIAGGGIRGGQFFGKYPDSLKPEGAENLGGRGRLVPQIGWESMWKGIIEWFGVEDAAAMSTVLPNLKYYPEDKVFDRRELFN